MKAASFTAVLMMLFFFFGALHDLIKSAHLQTWLSSYKLIITVMFVSLAVFFLYIKRRKIFQGKILHYCNVLFVLLTFIELCRLGIGLVMHKNHHDYETNNFTLMPAAGKQQTMPDIYFIVFDEYTSSDCLMTEFGFDNTRLDSLLLSHHFFISRSSKSNYNLTPLSVASTLNLDYLREDLEGRRMTAKLLLQGVQTLEQTKLPVYLAQSGYTIKNFSWFDLHGYPCGYKSMFEYLREKVNNESTLYGRIKKDIWWNFSNMPFLNSLEIFIKPHQTLDQRNINANKFNFDRLARELKTTEINPKFVYCHLMLPHEPFLLDKNGKILSDSLRTKYSGDVDSLYLGQLQYANKLIDQLMPDITKTMTRPRVVIIEGDHGFRFYNKLKVKNDIFKNLNAYYFSDNNYPDMYEGISPVNSFRVVLNKYFNQHLGMLPDRSVFINDSAITVPE